MSLKGTAKQTLEILERGRYESVSGRRVEIGSAQTAAVEGTRLYRPKDLDVLDLSESASEPKLKIEVTTESTQVAAQRLASLDVVLLNYASAKNPGGGFLGGAKAQEEDLARCSGLYNCLLTQPEYYAVNRRQKSMLYTDHIIYSPRVPFFRIGRSELLDEAFLASVITAPAPNAGEHFRRDPDGKNALTEALERRAGKVLSVAKDQGHRTLLLGAWGCGVFRNDPEQMADVFARWLAHPAFADAFDQVTFAVMAKNETDPNLRAFRSRFQA